MKLRTYLAAALVAVTALTLAPNAATATGGGGDGGGNQQCSQRGGSKNTNIITCVVPTVSLGNISLKIVDDVDVLTGDQINLVVENVKVDVDVLRIHNFDVLSGRQLVYINNVLSENVIQVCTGNNNGPNFCRNQNNK